MWEYLRAPAKDADGNDYHCLPDNGCHLHLHGVTQGFGPFYSVASATGLILATGTVGSYLNSVPGLINTYFSRDGGLTWEEIAKGSHIYEIADHGGLIVMATDQAPTMYLYYSWNQGQTFHKYKFTDAPIVVENIITEPSSTSQHVIVYGSAEVIGASQKQPHAGSGVGVVVYVDFSVLRTRACEGIDAAGSSHSDYELWSPNDGRSEGACLMGHTTTYVRRKQASECYIPQMAQKPRLVANCACTEADFECDAGYVRDVTTKQCVPDLDAETVMVDAATDARKRCETQSFYRATKGYRRVPGNTCLGGQEWEALVVPCPSGWLSASHSPAVVLLIVFIIAFAAIVVFRMDYADDLIRALKARFNIAQGYFKVGVPGSAPASMAEDDGDGDGGETDPLYLDESEFESVRTLDAKDIRALRHAAAAAASKVGGSSSGNSSHLNAGDLSLESDSDAARVSRVTSQQQSQVPAQMHPALAAKAKAQAQAQAQALALQQQRGGLPSLQPPPQE